MMRKVLSIMLLTGSILFSFSDPVFADRVHVEEEGLESLLFEEIPVVSIAAKKEESLLSASGTVYVITDKDIERYGWRDLKEILNAIPNMDLMWQYNWLNGGQRGFTGNFSGTLLMIDGREVQNLLASEAFMTNDFPSHRIKRVEILQGPNSTLYGGNATQGVINIITKFGDKGDTELNEGEFIYGQADTRQMAGVFKKKTENSELGFSASWFKSQQDWEEIAEFVADDSKFSRSPEKDQYRYKGTDNFRMPEECWTTDLYVRYKGVYGGMNYFKEINNTGIEYVHYDSLHEEARRGYWQPYIGYKQSFSENVNAFIEYQRVEEDESWLVLNEVNKEQWTSYEDIQLEVRGESFEKTVRDRILLQTDILLGEKNHIIAGYDWWKLTIDDYLTKNNILYPEDSPENIPAGWPSDKSTVEKQSVFIQDTFDAAESLKVTMGIRYNKQDYTNDSWLPRISAVYMPTQESALKLTYGKAFRAPNIFEFNGTETDSLDSQEMEMYELNYTQNAQLGEYLQLSNTAAVYQMTNSNLYSKVYDAELAAQSTSHFAGWRTIVSGEYEVVGFEDLVKLTYKRLSGFFGFRWVHPDETTVNGEDIANGIPITKFKLGCSYQFLSYLDASLFIDHWSKVKSEVNQLDGTGTEVYEIDPWTQVDFNMNVGEFDLETMKVKISLYVKNIFDEEVYQANVRGTTPIQYRQYPRDARLKASLKF